MTMRMFRLGFTFVIAVVIVIVLLLLLRLDVSMLVAVGVVAFLSIFISHPSFIMSSTHRTFLS